MQVVNQLQNFHFQLQKNKSKSKSKKNLLHKNVAHKTYAWIALSVVCVFHKINNNYNGSMWQCSYAAVPYKDKLNTKIQMGHCCIKEVRVKYEIWVTYN